MCNLCVSKQKLIDEIVEDKLLLKTLMKALETLTEEERFLIDEIYFKNKTEREVAVIKDISQQSINKRKIKILEKLKKYFK